MPCGTCVRYEYNCEYTSAKRGSYVPVDHALSEALPPRPVVVATESGHVKRQPHPLTAPGARFHHRGILDPTKTRFVRANSAIAFPRILGMDLEAESIPRLHSFAWHLGLRAEPQEEVTPVTSLMTWPEMQQLAEIYFRIVRVEIGLLDEAEFMTAASTRFANPQGQDDFDVVIFGVAALGSFFAPTPHPRENQFVASSCTQLHERTLSRSVTINSVAGWILRTLYLRLTGRPHASWVSSCITLHQVEASGLHKELQSIAVVYPAMPTTDNKLVQSRRKLFWIAKALNVLLGFEYGRSKVHFEVVTTKKFAPDNTSHAHLIVELAEILPSDFVDPEQEPDPPAALTSALTTIEEMQSDSPWINLLRADVAFGIYRRLWLMSLTDAKDRAESVMCIGKAGLKASSQLLATRTPWWNVLSTTFQFLCVVIAVDTPKSLGLVAGIVEQLRHIAQVYDTHMVREAYNQALSLAHMSRVRKERELQALSAVNLLTPFEDPPTQASSGNMPDLANIDWSAMEMPFDWDIMLNPNLVVSSQQGQFGPVATFPDQLGLDGRAR